MSTPNDDQPARISDWPADWPGRRFVDLDCVGDPGAWLENQIPDAIEVVLGDSAEDEETAEMLADAYINAAEEQGFPLPSDFEGTSEETREMTVADFLGFIREWRRRTIAEQAAKHSGKKSA
jgi:hypothetical protein